MKLDFKLTYLQLHSAFLTIKQIGDEHVFNIFNIFRPTLAKRILL